MTVLHPESISRAQTIQCNIKDEYEVHLPYSSFIMAPKDNMWDFPLWTEFPAK